MSKDDNWIERSLKNLGCKKSHGKLSKSSIRFLVTAFLLGGLGSFAIPTHAQIQQNSQLAVEVGGLRNQQGQVCLSLFATGRGFPSRNTNAVQNQCVAITAIPQLVTFQDVSPGSYAVAVLHDANNDSEVNRNALGIPREGFGFSRNPVIQTGPPDFGDAVILVAGPRTNIQVQLNYF